MSRDGDWELCGGLLGLCTSLGLLRVERILVLNLGDGGEGYNERGLLREIDRDLAVRVALRRTTRIN